MVCLTGQKVLRDPFCLTLSFGFIGTQFVLVAIVSLILSILITMRLTLPLLLFISFLSTINQDIKTI